MLPPGLQSTYKTYKEDTDIIATWLAVNAKRCGYPADLLDRVGASDAGKAIQASTRLKGKARKKAQDSAKGTPAPAKPLIKVPGTLVQALDRAILLRKEVQLRDRNV